MKTSLSGLCMTSLALLALSGPAKALPTSTCIVNTNNANTCDIYESDANGDFSERPPEVTLAVPGVISGFLVLVDDMNGDLDDYKHNWSDILWFKDTGWGTGTLTGVANVIQFFSDPLFEFWPEPMPFTVDDVMNSLNVFMAEEPMDPTVYQPDDNIYNIYAALADEDNFDAPEPGTIVLLATGLLGLGVARRKRTA